RNVPAAENGVIKLDPPLAVRCQARLHEPLTVLVLSYRWHKDRQTHERGLYPVQAVAFHGKDEGKLTPVPAPARPREVESITVRLKGIPREVRLREWQSPD